MALISLQNISIAFGGPLLLDNLNLQIQKNQRICLLGRNGAGKSTLMKILAGTLKPDNGTVLKDASVHVSYFEQDIPDSFEGSVFDIIAGGLGIRGKLLVKYHHEEQRLTLHPEYDHVVMDQLHEDMNKHDSWSALEEIGKIATRMSIDFELMYSQLSGGQKRRVLLARALVSSPDLLLLDEPTNHLDIDSIAWMEDYLLKQNITLLFVTHDRMLLRRLATRIVELDRGQLVDWSCTYDTFLERKQRVLEDEVKAWDRFDKKLAEEEIWIRKGIRARQTRDEGRVRALEKMRKERRHRRQREGAASLSIIEAGRSGKMVLEADNIRFSHDGKILIDGFTSRILRGDSIGIIGPNGCGKTTLINLLIKKLEPQSGTIRHGTNLEIVYFDQLRQQLDQEKSVRENVLLHGDYVIIGDDKRHIYSYLQDFLFTPERARTPVKALSGGEKNRLLLARLFTQQANVLVMDEPTNDLDVETLELLEELLLNFDGTLFLICHDRTFLNNVVASTLVFTENGIIEEHIGGYDDWAAIKARRKEKIFSPIKSIDKKEAYLSEKKARPKKKLSNKEAAELKSIPELINLLENEQAALHEKMIEPEFYKSGDKMSKAKQRLEEIEIELINLLERWEELETMQIYNSC
ncbi:ATP-binding cassette domain-containing protein [bacterium]|nr:ATP-binding cassette domain-containing protein [bacterium]